MPHWQYETPIFTIRLSESIQTSAEGCPLLEGIKFYEFPEPAYIKALPCNQKVQLRLTGIQTGVVANSITNQWAFKLSDGKISNGFTGALIP